MNHDTQALKNAMTCFATGVTVITTHYQGQDWGMTCNSFNTVSLDPAMVLWSIRQTSSSHQAFMQSGGYTVSILAADQLGVAMHFTRGTQAERFNGFELIRLSNQRPRIAGAVGWFDCSLDTTVSAGDHDILIGKVLNFGMQERPGPDALIYAQRQFGSLRVLEEVLLNA